MGYYNILTYQVLYLTCIFLQCVPVFSMCGYIIVVCVTFMLLLVKHWPEPLKYVVITKIIHIIIIIIQSGYFILKGVTFRTIIIAKKYSNFDHISMIH